MVSLSFEIPCSQLVVAPLVFFPVGAAVTPDGHGASFMIIDLAAL
jgi:hypothetical protein